MESIADDYDCSKSAVCRSIHWVEDTLSADGRFQLPGKKALQDDDSQTETPKTVAMDVTEHRIERPKKSIQSATAQTTPHLQAYLQTSPRRASVSVQFRSVCKTLEKLRANKKAYERTSVIVTTNLPFQQWPEILGNARLTGAVLDRLTHRCHILEATGESYRQRAARKRIKSQEKE